MNRKGNNSTWILCSSKSIPGKFYYFNVVTGEAAWCLSEAEKRTLAKEVNKVPDRTHTFPKPNTPPTEETTDISNMFYNFTAPQTMPFNYYMGPPQIFSHPYSRFIPNQYMPSYGMPYPQMLPAVKPEPKKRSFDQITQTSDDHGPCYPGFTVIPLSKRFGSYRKEVTATKAFENKGIGSSNRNKGKSVTSNEANWWNRDTSKINDNFVKSSLFGAKNNKQYKITESTNENGHDTSRISVNFVKSSIFDLKDNKQYKIKEDANDNRLFNSKVNQVNMQERRILKDPVFNTIENGKNREIKKSIINSSDEDIAIFRKPKSMYGIEMNAKHNQANSAKPVPNTNIGHHSTKQSFNAQNGATNEDITQLTKKFTSATFSSKGLSQEENNNTTNYRNMQMQLDTSDLRFILRAKRRNPAPMNETSVKQTNDMNKLNDKKKQVKFDLRSCRDILQEVTMELPSEVSELEAVVSESNESLSKDSLKTDPWYIVVDIGVLLDDFDFIEDFVKKDTTCRLLVPNSVRSFIEDISLGENAGRHWVMLARKAMRRLSASEQHIVLQPPLTETPSSSVIDGIIECCLQVLKCNHVILITADAELYDKGVSSGIDTYKLEDVKHSIESEPQVTFKTGKIPSKSVNDNIFMQNTDDFEPFPISKSDSIFKVPKTITENNKKSLETSKYGTGSSIMFNKLLNNSNFKDPITVMKNKITPLENSKVEINRSVIFDKKPADNCNVLKVPIIQKKITVNRNPLTFDESVNFKEYLRNKPESNQEEINIVKRFDIEDEIQLLSIHDNKRKDSKVSDKFNNPIGNGKDFKRNFKNIIITTNVQREDGDDEETVTLLKMERRKNLFEKPIRNDDLNIEHPDVASANENGVRMKSLTVETKALNNNNTLKINAYTMEEKLKKFHVKDGIMSYRIESRLDEWRCCFFQIVEDCLTDILMNDSLPTLSMLPPPWSLTEAVMCLSEMYNSNTAIKTIAHRMTTILNNLSDKNDKLKNKIKPMDFMKLFGCGILLMEALKAVLPNSNPVLESERLLNSLLLKIQDTSQDIDLSISDMRVARCDIDVSDATNRNIVQKSRSEIIAYLQRHFPAWKDFDEGMAVPEHTVTQRKCDRKETTVIRTFGGKLNTINITKSNRICFDSTPSYKTHKIKENVAVEAVNVAPKVIVTAGDVEKEIGIKNMAVNKELSKDGKSFTEENNNDMPYKNYYDSTEDSTLDCSALDNDSDSVTNDLMIVTDDNAVPFVDVDNDIIHDDDLTAKTVDDGLEFDGNNDKIDAVDNNDGNCDNSTGDSGFVNQSLDACSFIRLFLSELSISFKLICTFINTSIQEFRSGSIQRENKMVLYDKANEIHMYVTDVIGKLRGIITREECDDTKLRSLIIKAGEEALADKRLTRYRQVIMKCYEQSQLLEGALKILLALTNENCDIEHVAIDKSHANAPYFNIFE